MELTKERMLEIAKNRKDCEFCFDSEDCDNCEKAKPISYEDLWEFYEKVIELLQADAEGRMIVLPCKVGDTVYSDNGVFGILEYEVDNIMINKTITYQCSAYSKSIGDCPSECLDEIEPDISGFGKTVFLTREEAEAALEKMGGGEK